MYRIIKRPSRIHFDEIFEDPLNERSKEIYTDEAIDFLCSHPESRVIIVNGDVLFLGGVTLYWEGRGKVWSLFSSKAKDAFYMVFKGMKRIVDECQVRRLELDVPFGEKRWERRAELLGFTKYAERARCYNNFGEDCVLFERIKDSGC